MYVCLFVCVRVFVVHKTWIFQKVWFIFSVFQIVWFVVIIYCCTCNALVSKSNTGIYKAIVTLEAVLTLFLRVLYNNLVLSLIYVKDVDEWMRIIFRMGHILLILHQFCLNVEILFCFKSSVVCCCEECFVKVWHTTWNVIWITMWHIWTNLFKCLKFCQFYFTFR